MFSLHTVVIKTVIAAPARIDTKKNGVTSKFLTCLGVFKCSSIRDLRMKIFVRSSEHLLNSEIS